MTAVLRLLLIVFAALPLLAAQQASDLAPSGTLRASFIATNPVQGRVDPKTLEATGPAPDLVRELARRLGVPYAIVPLPDAGRVLQSVVRGEVDMAFLAFEAERAAQVDFTDPYTASGAAYAVSAVSTFRRSEDVDRAGVTIGAVSGQSPEVYVREHVTRARVESLPAVPSNAEMGTMILSGRFQAFAANRTRMEELARAVPGIRVLEDNYMVTSQAIAVPKGQAARRAALNAFLADVRSSGFVKTSIGRANLAGVEVAVVK